MGIHVLMNVLHRGRWILQENLDYCLALEEWNKVDKAMAPEEVCSVILTRMKETAESYLGKEVKHAVISVPAYFNDQQRQSIRMPV